MSEIAHIKDHGEESMDLYYDSAVVGETKQYRYPAPMLLIVYCDDVAMAGREVVATRL